MSYYLEDSEDKLFQLRRKVYENEHLVCRICNQPLKNFRDTRNGNLYFRHKQDSDDCPIKTGIGISHEEIDRIKFQGAKESDARKAIKHHIAKYLTLDSAFEDIEEEQVVRSVDSESIAWRRPDVSANWNPHNVVLPTRG